MKSKLYMIVFSMMPPQARVHAYVKLSNPMASHHEGGGFTVTKETGNCWFLETYPDGMPRQYRKADEYRVVNNRNGIYMFGRDSEKLVEEWNKAALA